MSTRPSTSTSLKSVSKKWFTIKPLHHCNWFPFAGLVCIHPAPQIVGLFRSNSNCNCWSQFQIHQTGAPKPPQTILNHPKTILNHPKTILNHPKPSPTIPNHPKPTFFGTQQLLSPPTVFHLSHLTRMAAESQLGDPSEAGRSKRANASGTTHNIIIEVNNYIHTLIYLSCS